MCYDPKVQISIFELRGKNDLIPLMLAMSQRLKKLIFSAPTKNPFLEIAVEKLPNKNKKRPTNVSKNEFKVTRKNGFENPISFKRSD